MDGHSDDSKAYLDLVIDADKTSFISTALRNAQAEKDDLDFQLIESKDSVKALTPECDTLDYALAASSGMLCGVIDIFLVGSPEESALGKVSDEWTAKCTKSFARLNGWSPKEDLGDDRSLKSAIAHLERKYKIPYDQTGRGESGSIVYDLKPSNHHFKSLAHNPSLLGLFYSILDQFYDTSHFVSSGELITLEKADEKFELKGHDVPSKLFCATANWIGHLISDQSGASGSKTRGMGIPSPLWIWVNDVIAIKSELKIPVSEFDNSINELALNIFKQGYDARFQVAQAIPVFINELVTRLMYSMRRLGGYLINNPINKWSFEEMWIACEPFSNATVKRMLTVSHAAFCAMDISDAVIRGASTGSVAEFVLRVNVVGVGRFAISVAGEFERSHQRRILEEHSREIENQQTILNDYIEGLKLLADVYDDSNLLDFVDDLKSSDAYMLALNKTILLAEKRNVDESKVIRTKSDIDNYFKGGQK